jgi:hypothetical protein
MDRIQVETTGTMSIKSLVGIFFLDPFPGLPFNSRYSWTGKQNPNSLAQLGSKIPFGHPLLKTAIGVAPSISNAIVVVPIGEVPGSTVRGHSLSLQLREKFLYYFHGGPASDERQFSGRCTAVLWTILSMYVKRRVEKVNNNFFDFVCTRNYVAFEKPSLSYWSTSLAFKRITPLDSEFWSVSNHRKSHKVLKGIRQNSSR